MTPEDILQDLRDIHLPATEAGGGLEFAAAPFLILAALVAAGAVLALWRKGLWRFQAGARLREIEKATDRDAQWPLMIDLLRRLSRFAHAAPPPDCVFRPPERIGAAEREAVRRYLRAGLWR